jgi:hypothetical protein
MFRDFQIKLQVKRASIKLMFSILNAADEFCAFGSFSLLLEKRKERKQKLKLLAQRRYQGIFNDDRE